MASRSGAYDAIVVGLGGMGSAAVFHLARRGQRVLGLDAFQRGHTQGASHGRSRIIREAYYEAPEYVPLLRRAYALWRELEGASGRALLEITGGLNIGAPDGELVRGVVASAGVHGLAHEVLDASAVAARFPAYRLPKGMTAVYEPNAGVLAPEACVAAHLDLAGGAGAELRFGEPVRHWSTRDVQNEDSSGGGSDGATAIEVETAGATYRAARLVITAGPWAAELLGGAAPPLEVRRVVNVHFRPSPADLLAPAGADRTARAPVFIWHVPEGWYYGVPGPAEHGLKFGRHDSGERCTPQTIRRDVGEDEVAALRAVLERYLPGAASRVTDTLTCMYTLTPDRHFVLDRHPAYRHVVYGCGFSGHGFKFCSAIGEALADLSLGQAPACPIDFLSARRFSGA